MTNPERDPDEVVLAPGEECEGVELLEPRDVPLGGPRAMTVRRTLPQRQRSLIGAWCFVDHYGPDRVADTGGMNVTPHPHTGLQTVSWLFTGEVEHRDSIGTHAMVVPGEMNLMTGGRGISHSEISTPDTDVLHGVQLWVALPEEARSTEPRFEHHRPEAIAGEGWEARVFIGELLGQRSPITTHSPMVGAELLVRPGATLTLDVDEAFEHGVLVDTGVALLGEREVKTGELGYVAPGRARLTLAPAGGEAIRVLLIGGEPFGEAIVMWWNFIGRTHEEVAGYREEWQRQITRSGEVVGDSRLVADGRFGVVDEPSRPIPAPPLPNVRLKERR